MVKRIVALGLLLFVAAACAHEKYLPIKEHDGDPLALVAVGFACKLLVLDPDCLHGQVGTAEKPCTTKEQKAKAREAMYEQAYRFARAEGMKPTACDRYGAAFADDSPLPNFACADFVDAPADCNLAPAVTKATLDCTESRVRVSSGAASDAACTPIRAPSR